MNGINLELITDIDMYQMVEKGLRGGISYIANRCSKPNNKYIYDYDKDKESSYLMYIVANNLYGWAMSQSLPTGGFKWLKKINGMTYRIMGYFRVPKFSQFCLKNMGIIVRGF